MSERPSGTVTFLTTDIEGSTRLWQQHHDAMKTALADHDRLVRSTIESHDGYVFSTAGDSFWAAFTNPVDAALAALDTHRVIASQDWGEIGALRVRAALDTGLADERDGDYFGPPLNRASRIMKHAGGGDTLCSHTTADLLKHDLPIGYAVAKVGRKRLQDVEDVETLYRITTTVDATRPARSIPVFAVVAMAVAVGFGWWATSGGGEGDHDRPDHTTTTTTTEAPESALRWTTEVGIVAVAPIVVGDVVAIAVEEPERALVALGVDTGVEKWRRTDLGQIRQLATDDAFLYVTTGRRLDILNPVDGEPVPRCGFDLPKGLASTVVQQEATFVLTTGVAYRIATQPGRDPCQRLPVENARFIDGFGDLAGVTAAAGHLLAGDARGLYLFDAASLGGVWKVPAEEPVVRVRPRGVAIADIQIEMRNEVRQTTVAVAVDEDGLLHLFDTSDGPGRIAIPQTLVSSGWTPIAVGDTIIVHQPDGRMLALDTLTGAERWHLTIDPAPVVDTEQDVLAVAIADEIVGLRARTGEKLWAVAVSEPLTQIRLTPTVIVAVADTSVTLLRRPDARDLGPPLALEITPVDISPDQVIEDFADAWNRGDAGRAEGLLAPQMRFPIVGLTEPMWPEGNQTYFWNWFGHDVLMGATWHILDCTTDDAISTSLGGPWTVRTTCDVEYTDRLLNAAGQDSLIFQPVFDVTNGLIQSLSAPEGRFGWGGRWALYDQFEDWVSAEYPAEHGAACIESGEDISPGCATFKVAHLDEWAATLGT